MSFLGDVLGDLTQKPKPPTSGPGSLLAMLLAPADATSAISHPAINRSIPWGTASGGPTILNQAPPAPNTPGQYKPPTLVSRGDTVFLKSDGSAPLDFVMNHEIAHRDYLRNDPRDIPQEYRPPGPPSPLIQSFVHDQRMGTERFAQAMSEAKRSLYGSAPFGPDSSTAHRADPAQVARLRQTLIQQMVGSK